MRPGTEYRLTTGEKVKVLYPPSPKLMRSLNAVDKKLEWTHKSVWYVKVRVLKTEEVREVLQEALLAEAEWEAQRPKQTRKKKVLTPEPDREAVQRI